MVNANTEHPQEAWELVAKLTSADVQSTIAALGTNIPSRAYSDQSAVDAFLATFDGAINNEAWINGLEYSVAEAPLWNGDWPQIDQAIFNGVTQILNGEMTPRRLRGDHLRRSRPVLRSGITFEVTLGGDRHDLPRFGHPLHTSNDRGRIRYMASRVEDHRVDAPKLSRFVLAAVIWNGFVVFGSALLARYVFQLEDFYNLGNSVQTFVGLLALVPGALAIVSAVGLLRRASSGRQVFLVVNYVGMVLASFYLLHLWDVFVGIDDVGATLHQHRIWLLGFVIAYAVFWIAGKLPENSRVRTLTEQAALGLAMITLVVLLVVGDALSGIMSILDTYAEPQTWIVTALIAVFGFMAWRMLHQGDYFGETPDQRAAWQGWLMLSPNAIGFMVFFAGPLLLSFYFSFTDSTGVKPPNFVGVDNYRRHSVRSVQDAGRSRRRPQDVLDRRLSGARTGGRRLAPPGDRRQRYALLAEPAQHHCLLPAAGAAQHHSRAGPVD